MFSAYQENPTNCRFAGQDDDEEIILLVRAHPVTNLPWILGSLLLLILPFILPQVLSLLALNFAAIPENIVITFLIINYLLVLIIVFEGFLNWYFNVNILTDRRLVDIDFDSILLSNVDMTDLRNIQEASASTGGLFGIIFNFGHVYIQTAGARVGIDMFNVPNSHAVADKILDQARLKGGGAGGPH